MVATTSSGAKAKIAIAIDADVLAHLKRRKKAERTSISALLNQLALADMRTAERADQQPKVA